MDRTYWDNEAGVIALADGRRVRARALHAPMPRVRPQYGLYLLDYPPPDDLEWETRWLRWPDLRLPHDRDDALDAFREAFVRAGSERVEVACSAGTFRTVTALACLAVMAGTPPDDALAFVRQRYRVRTREMPWQRRYVHEFTPEPVIDASIGGRSTGRSGGPAPTRRVPRGYVAPAAARHGSSRGGRPRSV